MGLLFGAKVGSTNFNYKHRYVFPIHAKCLTSCRSGGQGTSKHGGPTSGDGEDLGAQLCSLVLELISRPYG